MAYRDRARLGLRDVCVEGAARAPHEMDELPRKSATSIDCPRRASDASAEQHRPIRSRARAVTPARLCAHPCPGPTECRAPRHDAEPSDALQSAVHGRSGLHRSRRAGSRPLLARSAARRSHRAASTGDANAGRQVTSPQGRGESSGAATNRRQRRADAEGAALFGREAEPAAAITAQAIDERCVADE